MIIYDNQTELSKFAWLEYYIPQSRKDVNNMAYNPRNTQVLKGLPAGVIAPVLVTKLIDGVIKDFITDVEAQKKWDNLEQPAISVTLEVTYNDKKYGFVKLFPYKEIDGKTSFGDKSDLGKYSKYYKKAPEEGDQCKAITNSDGYWRLLLE